MVIYSLKLQKLKKTPNTIFKKKKKLY